MDAFTLKVVLSIIITELTALEIDLGTIGQEFNTLTTKAQSPNVFQYERSSVPW